jgi:hypothetical protein
MDFLLLVVGSVQDQSYKVSVPGAKKQLTRFLLFEFDSVPWFRRKTRSRMSGDPKEKKAL